MNPSKLLISGVATVGSVATVAIAANHFGLTASSETPDTSPTNLASQDPVKNVQPVSQINQETRMVRTGSAGLTSTTSEISNKESLKAWETQNNRKIQIKKDNGSPKSFEDGSIADDDLENLSGYLSVNSARKLIEPVSSSLDKEIPFIFKKCHVTEENEWDISTKEQIDAWIKHSLKNETIRQIEGLDKCISFEELKKLLDYLNGKENLFKKTQGETKDNEKTILFEQVGSDWKHSKTEIKEWLKTDGGKNKFEIKIEKDGEKTLDEIDEANLEGLLGYLKGKESDLTKLIKDSVSTYLTFKKESENWNVVHSQTTIENWVYNTSSGKVSLELYDYLTNEKQELSSLKKESDDFKKLFDSLERKKDLFENSASETSQKTIIFEKYTLKEESYGESKSWEWTHIKEAIKDYLKDGSLCKSIEIQIGNEAKNMSEVVDDNLKGLLHHLYDDDDDTTSYNGKESCKLIFKDSEWQEYKET